MRFRKWLLVGVPVGGALAIGMAASNLQSPVRSAVVLIFLIFAPPLAISGLLRGFEPLARAILAFASGLVLLTLTAMIMLAGGFWSPSGDLVVVTTLSTACVVAQCSPVARRLSAAADVLARH